LRVEQLETQCRNLNPTVLPEPSRPVVQNPLHR
jgi:hypothetical protein